MTIERTGAPRTASLVATDGTRLAMRLWQPTEEPVGVVVLAHGLGEHAGRYDHVAAALNRAGFAVLAADHRGHGRSPGRRGHAAWADLVDDLGRAVARARAEWPDLPVFLYGHSLGGALVVRFGQVRGDGVAGIVASAPAFRPAFRPPAWKLAVARALSGIWPSLTMSNELDDNAICRDPDVVRAYKEDPLTHHRISAGLAMAVLEQGEAALASAGAREIPLLLIHGDADRLTDFDASCQFALDAGGGVELLRVRDGFHEPHNDPGHEELLERVGRWLRERAARLEGHS
jgi:alpha-beta hydrolase superfamily lysophospholipase